MGFISSSNTCKTGTIDPTKIKGKILICLTGDSGTFEMGSIAAEGGAVGLILANNEFDGNELNARADLLPTANINFADGQSIFTYINSNKYSILFFSISFPIPEAVSFTLNYVYV